MAYSVRFSSGTGGSVNPSGIVSNTTTFEASTTATRSAGYRFNVWTGTLVDNGTVSQG